MVSSHGLCRLVTVGSDKHNQWFARSAGSTCCGVFALLFLMVSLVGWWVGWLVGWLVGGLVGGCCQIFARGMLCRAVQCLAAWRLSRAPHRGGGGGGLRGRFRCLLLLLL
eukprot:scpid108592/ scgid30034/ 